MAAAVLAFSWLGVSIVPPARPAQTTTAPAPLSPRIADQDFWRLVARTSEPNGYFDSDNLVSNEDGYQTVIPSLMALPHTGAYVGVGPDQNFSYIVALRPPVAFIMDVRRGNLQLHLMYKAILELSPDRAAFLSMLFSRARPSGLTARTSPDDLFRAFDRAEPDRNAYTANLHAILQHLETDHGFRLDPDDQQGIAYVYSSFFNGGPALRFVSSRGGSRYPSYEDLQLATDAAGVRRGYLASEEAYGTLRTWEQRNLIVPVVGNFAGPHALRAIGTYLRDHDTPVRVFYTSNVERYLFQDGLWRTFVGNVRALPVDNASTLIRSCFDSCSGPGDSRAVTLLDTIPALLRDVDAGRVTGYGDVLRRSRRR
jgi:hypothetical protein